MNPTSPTPAGPTFNLFGLELPVRATIACVVGTLALVTDWYYNFAENFLPTPTYPDTLRHAAYDHFVLYLVIPMIIVVLVFRQKPADYGFRLGDWKAGLKLTLLAWAIAAPILYIAGRSPDVQQYYVRYFKSTGDVLFTAGVELVAWEFFFRGFLLWSLAEAAGPGAAVVLQAVPFAMAHFRKPYVETASTVFGGIMFGWVGWRTRSFFWPFLIHLFISTVVVFVAVWAG